MRRPVYIEDDWSGGQGLGWRAARRGENVFWNHGGALHGFSTAVVFHVSARAGVIILANMWPHGTASDLPFRLAEMVVGTTGDTEAKTPPAAYADVGGSVESECAGEYWAEPGLPLTVITTEAGLAFRPHSGGPGLHCPADLEPGEPDEFKVLNGRGAGETALFARAVSGEVTGFSLGGFRYRKIS